MWKGLVLLVVLGAMSGVTAGVSTYDTVLFDESLNEHFRVSGWVQGDQSGNDTVLDFTYDVDLIREAFNKTTANRFTVEVRQGGKVLLEKGLGGFSIDRNQTHSGSPQLVVPAAPWEINEIRISINHTATLRDGATVNALAEGKFDYEVDVSEQAVNEVGLNTSTVARGGEVFLRVDTDNIDSLAVNGTELSGDSGIYTGWVPVPDGVTLGETTLRFVLRTDRGEVFIHEEAVTVENAPPTLDVSHRGTVQQGADLTVQATTSDDVAGTEAVLYFQNQSYRFTDPTVSIPTVNLTEGRYSFTVNATDADGATTSTAETFRVEPRVTGGTSGQDGGEDGTGDNSDGNESGEEYSGTESFFIRVVNGISSFLQGLLFGGE